MTAAKAEFDKIDWDKLDAAQAIEVADRKSIPKVNAAFEAAKTHVTQVIEGKVRPKIKDIRDLAEKAHAEWSKSKLIPKASADHALKVKTTADTYWIVLKNNSPTITNLLTEFTKLISKLQTQVEEQKKGLETYIKNLEESLKLCSANPSFHNYENLPDMAKVSTSAAAACATPSPSCRS